MLAETYHGAQRFPRVVACRELAVHELKENNQISTHGQISVVGENKQGRLKEQGKVGQLRGELVALPFFLEISVNFPKTKTQGKDRVGVEPRGFMCYC